MKMYNTILTEHKEEGYVIITMNRPGGLNALSKDMRLELTDCFTHLEGDTSVKTIILTGGDY
nr:enoyl-CoA hydratase-related protein [Syntrophales bacterium]